MECSAETQALKKFYNDTYTSHPGMWENWWRDEYVCKVLSEFPEPKHLLDIGCGNGHTLERLRIYYPNVHLYGLEISEVAIRLAECGSTNAEFYCGRFEEMEMPRKFDRIISLGVFEHMKKPIRAFEKVKEWLTDDGLFYLEVPDNVFSGSEGWFVAHFGDQIEWHLNKEFWEKIIVASGFNIKKSIVNTRGSPNFIWICSI